MSSRLSALCSLRSAVCCPKFYTLHSFFESACYFLPPGFGSQRLANSALLSTVSGPRSPVSALYAMRMAQSGYPQHPIPYTLFSPLRPLRESPFLRSSPLLRTWRLLRELSYLRSSPMFGQPSIKVLSLLVRLGCLSLRSALASIWRIRSLVTANF